MALTVRIFKGGKDWGVNLESIKTHQYFLMAYHGPKADCRWYAKMLRKAIKAHTVSRKRATIGK